MGNQKYVVVVNFDGYISVLSRDGLGVLHQFYAKGKEIRHSCLTESMLVVSCELMAGSD